LENRLGGYEVGESHLGFPQALLLAGSRSVCVSLWRVNDTATALLMTRFYQNLLEAREGLKGPLPKARALQEAKEWLRGLSRGEALRLAAAATKGVARGKRPALPPTPGGRRRSWATARSGRTPTPTSGPPSSSSAHPTEPPVRWVARL
jgi:CHAT domain-containing protein